MKGRIFAFIIFIKPDQNVKIIFIFSNLYRTQIQTKNWMQNLRNMGIFYTLRRSKISDIKEFNFWPIRILKAEIINTDKATIQMRHKKFIESKNKALGQYPGCLVYFRANKVLVAPICLIPTEVKWWRTPSFNSWHD